MAAGLERDAAARFSCCRLENAFLAISASLIWAEIWAEIVALMLSLVMKDLATIN
jgi:hypothetical protein